MVTWSQCVVTFVVDASPEFEEFLQFLGERITLKDWKGYRGGLSTFSKFL
jgi:hypothetical protein